ncbi:MAG: hypothetical protein PHH31_07925 [Acidaminococcaceae bacterium]|nr:hypothetical protein [Acidaminococcaceae bacterium]
MAEHTTGIGPLGILLMGLLGVAIMFTFNNLGLGLSDYVKHEQENCTALLSIWNEIDENYKEWQKGNIDREELARRSLPLVHQLDKINDSYKEFPNSDKTKTDNEYHKMSIVISENIRLKTQVMLFDFVRGFNLKNNQFAGSDKASDDILKYVYDKRKKAFEEDKEYFMDVLNKL